MIRLTNTLTGKKEELLPIHRGEVSMYVCGPTVYNIVHIGNARPAIVFDALRNYLESRGLKVVMVQNFTDIDDKIINRMNQEGWDFRTITDTYIREYRKDMQQLGVREPNFSPRTSYFVPETVEFIQGLIENAHAYVTGGDVFFDVLSFPNYGELSHRKVEDLLAGARVEVDASKKHPADFSLWKASKPGEPAWDSPWGKGRPGWHIECSVMSSVLLGDTFDIHAGGNDLIFPHHENEKAQSECLTGKSPANLWLHNGMLQMSGSKMAKSVGNIIKIREAIQKYGVDALRLYMLSTHYRSPIDYVEERMDDWKKSASKVYAFLQEIEATIPNLTVKSTSGWLEEKRAELQEALDDDFNTPKAIALIFETVKPLAHCEDSEVLRNAYYFIRKDVGDILGLFQSEAPYQARENKEEADGNKQALMQLILQLRNRARIEKNFLTADWIRLELEKIGIRIMDGTHGTTWDQK